MLRYTKITKEGLQSCFWWHCNVTLLPVKLSEILDSQISHSEAKPMGGAVVLSKLMSNSSPKYWANLLVVWWILFSRLTVTTKQKDAKRFWENPAESKHHIEEKISHTHTQVVGPQPGRSWAHWYWTGPCSCMAQPVQLRCWTKASNSHQEEFRKAPPPLLVKKKAW